MRKLTRVGACSLLLLSTVSCTDKADLGGETTVAEQTTQDPLSPIITTLEADGWINLPLGTTGAAGPVVEMTAPRGPLDSARFIVQSHTTKHDPADRRDRFIRQLDLDPTISSVEDAGTRNFGSAPGFGVQYVNDGLGRVTQSWYVRTGDVLLTITIDFEGEQLLEELTAYLDDIEF